MFPYEFRAKDINELQVQESIAEPSSVDIEHQSDEAQDPEEEEEKALENNPEAGQDIIKSTPPCDNQVEPSDKSVQESEALQIDMILEENKMIQKV